MNAPRLWKFLKECLNGIAKDAKVFCKQKNAGFFLSIRKTRTLTPFPIVQRILNTSSMVMVQKYWLHVISRPKIMEELELKKHGLKVKSTNLVHNVAENTCTVF